MTDILKDDPAFNPVYSRGSLATKRKEDLAEDDNDSAEEGQTASEDMEKTPKSSKKKKNMVDELKEFLQSRDDKFLEVLKEMNESNNKLLEKLAAANK